MNPSDDMSLGEARDWLRERIDNGQRCPCCQQFAKVYRRKIHTAMARSLIVIYRSTQPWEWCHLPTVLGINGGDTAKATYWGLLEEEAIIRSDGGRAGWWRLTIKGRQYVEDRVRVPKYARIYDGRCLSLVGDPVGVRDALGDGFDLADLMRGE